MNEGLSADAERQFQFRSIEFIANALCTFAGDIRAPFDFAQATFSPGRLDGLVVPLFVSTGEFFKSGVVVAAIQDAKRHRIDFRNRDVKM